ncbi:hypothetical protein LTS08_002952 [Lithohypha guttulata]|nr:hypothetical protein LTS08_002952 [Lithohypha guttulata]
MLLSALEAPETAPLEAQYGAQLAWSTGSRATIALAQEWLRSCLLSHVACVDQKKTTAFTRKLPSRLIKLGSDEPYIVNTSDLAYDTAYLTLSHMWGDAQFLMLLSANIDQLRVAIPSEGLSQTHRDALSITRSLGYDYIWIDSLCIIQDSSSDWRSQAALMASVYGNSSCTIAAASGTGEGCFIIRNPLMQRACRLTEGISTQDSGVYAHPYHSSRWGDYSNRYYINNPILKRAWIQQERILSPRILYFGSEELHWECCSLQASESWPGGQPNPEHGHDYVYPLKAAFATQLKPYRDWDFDDYHAFIYELWHYGIFEAYTRAELTYEKDRLVALAGIAEVIQHKTGMTYAAGLWKELMPAELLWMNGEAPKPGQTHLTDMPWQAPSWSWTSSTGYKRHDVGAFWKVLRTDDMIYVSRILACVVNPLVNEDQVLGEVVGGTITVTGFLVRLPRTGVIDDRGARGHVRFDIDVSKFDELFHLCLLRFRDGEGRAANEGLILARMEGQGQSAEGEEYYVRVGVFVGSYLLESGCVFDGLEEVCVNIH